MALERPKFFSLPKELRRLAESTPPPLPCIKAASYSSSSPENSVLVRTPLPSATASPSPPHH